MDKFIVISSDCHAGLPPEQYREWVDPKFRDVFDVALPIQIEEVKAAAKKFLVADVNEEWRKGIEPELTGAWDSDVRNQVLDADGITEMNMPPFGAGISLPTDPPIVPELQWVGARAHNRWVAQFCQMAPERRAGLAVTPICWDDLDASVAEIRWARENGLKGILIPS